MKQQSQQTGGSGRNCLHCGGVLEGGRSTRRYCSDTCKLAAFHRRKNEQPNIDECDRPTESSAATALNGSAMVLNVNPLTVNGNTNVSNVNPVTLNRNNTVANVTAVTLNNSVVTVPNVNSVTLNGNNSVALAALEAEAEALSAALADSSIDLLPETVPAEKAPKEPVYRAVICPLLEDVADAYDHHAYQHITAKDSYRSPLEAMDTRWNEERLRAILEQALSMAEQRSVKNKHLLQLRDMLADLMGSRPFGRLSPQYPFIAAAKMLQQLLEHRCEGMTRFGGTRLCIHHRQKVLLMVARYTLAGRVEKMLVEGLDFTGTVQTPY